MKTLLNFVILILLGANVVAQIEVNQYGNVNIGGTVNYPYSYQYDLVVTGNSRFKNYVEFNTEPSLNGGVEINNTAYIVAPPSQDHALKVSGETRYATLYVDGDIECTGIYIGSDNRYKEKIKSLNSSVAFERHRGTASKYTNTSSILSKLNDLEAKEYEFKSEATLRKEYKKNVKEYRDKNKLVLPDSIVGDSVRIPRFPEGKQFGFLAQEVKEVYPELVRLDSLTGYYKVNYIGFVPVLWEAVKEQTILIEDLQQQVAENEVLKQQVATLEKQSAKHEDEMAYLRKEIEKLKRK